VPHHFYRSSATPAYSPSQRRQYASSLNESYPTASLLTVYMNLAGTYPRRHICPAPYFQKKKQISCNSTNYTNKQSPDQRPRIRLSSVCVWHQRLIGRLSWFGVTNSHSYSFLDGQPNFYVRAPIEKKHLLCWTSFNLSKLTRTGQIGQISSSLGHRKSECLSASRGLCPRTPDQGLCPWAPLGALFPDPHYRLTQNVRHSAPKLNSWIRPWSM